MMMIRMRVLHCILYNTSTNNNPDITYSMKIHVVMLCAVKTEDQDRQRQTQRYVIILTLSIHFSLFYLRFWFLACSKTRIIKYLFFNLHIKLNDGSVESR